VPRSCDDIRWLALPGFQQNAQSLLAAGEACGRGRETTGGAMEIEEQLLRAHGVEFSYLFNHYLTEHLARVNRAFEGDLTAALVLGTIAHQNLRRFHEEVVVRSPESMQELLLAGAHNEYMRPCNVMSVAASASIPRETVRRKVAWLVARGWVRRDGRDQLYLDDGVGEAFREFNVGTVRLFAEMLTQFSRTLERRQPEAPDTKPSGR
jgi:hypothetical protein